MIISIVLITLYFAAIRAVVNNNKENVFFTLVDLCVTVGEYQGPYRGGMEKELQRLLEQKLVRSDLSLACAVPIQPNPGKGYIQ